MACYSPLDVPKLPKDTNKPVELTPEQEEKRKTVLEHFSNDDYRVPEEEKGELMEEEKFWLVCEKSRLDGILLTSYSYRQTNAF
jgi:hypothetical protein